METDDVESLDLSLEVKDGLKDSSLDNSLDLSPDTQQAFELLKKDVKLVNDEKRNPKLEEKQARKLLWGGSNANVICTPKTDDDVKFKMESWFELLEQFKREKSPSGVRLDRTKITLSNGLYREGVGFEKTGKVLGKGNYAGDICVVRDIKTGQEHAIKKMMLSVFPTNEIRCWVDMSKTGFAPHLYLFNLDGNQVIMLMQILENAVTLRSVIDEHMSDFYKRDIDAALVKPFSLFVLDGALQAVSALHSKGWTHRDLHVGNVMLQKSSSESLTVKILDFGLAELLKGKTELDYCGFRADISEIVRMFSALNTGQEFDDVLDVQKNWKPKLEELRTCFSESDFDEMLCLIGDALAISHPAEVESYRNKVKDKLSLAMGDTPEKRSYNMRCIVSLLFSREEDKTELPIQCEDKLAAELSISPLLISNEERESVPLDQSCIGVENDHSCEPVDASQQHESNDRNNTIAPLAIEGGKGKKSKMFPQPAETEMPVETEVERPDDDNDIEPDDEEADINDRVVQFFEDRPYFYDTADERMTNKKLKDAELKAFAETIGLFPAKILRKWNNWQTDYGKLSLSEGRSGQGTVEKTRLQKWTIQHLAFLAPFIAHRSVQVIEIGGGADDKATEQLQAGSSDDESVPTVQEESALPGSCSFTDMKNTKPPEQKKFEEEDVSTSQSQLLEENSKKDTELSMTIDRSAEQPSERDTLAVLLGRVEHEVSIQEFRSFDTEMRELCRRFLSHKSVSTDATRTTEPVFMARLDSQLQQPDDRSTTSIPDMTPQTQSDNMRRIVDLLSSSQDFISVKQEDKTELQIQCQEELAHDLQLTELSTSLLSKKLKSNKERESVPQDVSCMEVGHHHSSGADDEATEQLQEGSPDEESVPTVQEESAPPGSCTFTSMKSTKTQQQKKFGEEEISTSLSQLLEENPNKHTELSMTIHRYTFAARLSSIVDQVPSQQFKAFQYLQSVGTDATRTTVPVPIARAVSLLQKPFRPFSAPAPVTQQYDFQSVYVSQFVYVSQLQTLMHLQQPMYPPISQSINSQAYSVINKDDTMTSLNLIDFRDLQRSTDAGGQNGRGKLYYLIAVIHKFARPFFFSYFNERKL